MTTLLAATRRLAADERTTVAALVAHLAEIDARRLAVAAGYSLFTYCREVLLLSEDAACNRTAAARTVREFPAILPMLADGRLNLATLRLLAPHLSPANHAELLADAAHKSKRKVEELVARRFPQEVDDVHPPDAPAARQVAGACGTAAGSDSLACDRRGSGPRGRQCGNCDLPDRRTAGSPRRRDRRRSAAISAARRPPLQGQRAVTPMAEDVFLIRLAAHRAMVDRLRRAQDLLAHAVPRGDVTEVFDRALMALIDDLEKKKFAKHAGKRPRRSHARATGSGSTRARSRPRSGAPSPPATRSAAPTSARSAVDATRPPTSSSTISGRTRSAARRRSRTSRCAARPTIGTRRTSTSRPIREAMSARHSIRPGAETAGTVGETVPGRA